MIISDKIRIVYLDHSNDFSGGQKSLLTLLSLIDRNKIDPFVIIDSLALKTEKELQKLNISYAKINYINIKYLEYILVPIVILKLFLLTNKLKCEILHCNTFKSGLMGAALTFFTSYQFIFRARLGIILLSHGLLDWIIFKRAHLILANSKYVKDTFVERFGSCENVKVVYNPLPEKFRLNTSNQFALRKKYFGNSELFYFGLIGRIESFKRLHDVVEAAEILIQKNIHFKILFIGANSGAEGDTYYQELQSQIRSKGLTQFFEFTGFISAIHEMTSLLSCVVLCTEGEALSRGVYESQALGIPVIASKSGGNTELVIDGKTGLLYKTSNIKSLADKMEILLSDRELQKSISIKAKEKILELFSFENTIVKEMNEYHRLTEIG